MRGLLIILLWLVCGAAAMAEEPRESEVAPGVFLVSSPKERSVTFRMIVRAGCADEDGGCRGVSHYLEHLVLVGRNAQHEDQALRFFADGWSNGWTRTAATGYVHGFPAGADAIERLDRLFAFYAARLQDFSVSAQDAARERNVVRQEHDWRIGSDPTAAAWREASIFLFEDHPIARWAIADPQTIAAYTVEDAKAFHARWYRRENVYFIVSGPLAEADLRKIVEQRLATAGDARPPQRGWLATAPTLKPDAMTVTRKDARISEASVALARALPAPALDWPRLQAARWLLGEYLSSRLPGSAHAELVDRLDIARSVRRASIDAPAPGVLQFIIQATPAEKVSPDDLAAALHRWLTDVAARGVDEATLARLKQRYALAFERASVSASTRAARLADWIAAPRPGAPDVAELALLPTTVEDTKKAEVDALLSAIAGPGREAQLRFLPADKP